MGLAGPAWPGQGGAAWGGEGQGGRNPALKLIFQAKQISPELSALAVYCCATRLRTLRPNPVPPQPCQVSSLSERKAKKLIREAGRSWDVGHLGAGGPVEACRLLVGGTLKLVSGKEIERASRAVKGSGGPQIGARGTSTQHVGSTGPAWMEGRGPREEGGCCLPLLGSSLVAGPDTGRGNGAG